MYSVVRKQIIVTLHIMLANQFGSVLNKYLKIYIDIFQHKFGFGNLKVNKDINFSLYIF